MVKPAGMRYFVGSGGLSVRNQPSRSTALAVGLNSSMVSFSGRPVWRVSASLTRMEAIAGEVGSAWPGEPSKALLGRQLALESHVSGGAVGSRITSEKPCPAVAGYQPFS